MPTPSGPYDPTPQSGESPQNPPPYPGYPPTPGYAPPSSPYGQSPYGQQPYGQPYGAPPVYPGYPMPPQPQKRSNKTLWIVLGVVGGVLVLACVLCAGGVIFLGSQLANSPLIGSSLVIGQFCSYEERQDYPQAYGLFSSNLQNQMTQDQFAQAGQSHDDSSGTVSYCQTSASSQGSAPQVSDTSASFPVTITRGGGSGSVGNTVAIGTTASGTITLVKESGAWKIDSIDPSLALT